MLMTLSFDYDKGTFINTSSKRIQSRLENTSLVVKSRVTLHLLPSHIVQAYIFLIFKWGIQS